MIRKHFKSICMKFLGLLVQLVPGWIFRHNGFCLAQGNAEQLPCGLVALIAWVLVGIHVFGKVGSFLGRNSCSRDFAQFLAGLDPNFSGFLRCQRSVFQARIENFKNRLVNVFIEATQPICS